MSEDELDPIWKALSDPTRRKILDLLNERPRTTGELAESFSLSRFAVMKHLGVLEGAGLIGVRREGRERWNHLNAQPLTRMYDRWLSRQAAWTPTLEGEAHAEPAPAPEDEEALKELYLVVRPEERYTVERAIQSVVPPIYTELHALGRGDYFYDRERFSWAKREQRAQFLPKTVLFLLVPESYVTPLLRAVSAALKIAGGPEDCGMGFAAVLPVEGELVIGAQSASPDARVAAEGWGKERAI